MPWTATSRAMIAESNRRRGEQDPSRRQAKRLYAQHRSNAKLRGVAFQLTFYEWWLVWQTSGKWTERGCGVGKYCMSRYGDEGAYAIGNVFINLFQQNTSEGTTGIKRTTEQNAARSRFMRGNTNFGHRKWVSKDDESRSVPASEVECYVEAGWHSGRDDMRGRNNTAANEK